jgi:glycosyltransferase involved in cell wall biosynthesis
MRILLGIPCFNEEAHISKTVRELTAQLQDYSNSIEIIVFDDASTDQSVQFALETGASVHVSRTNGGLGNNFHKIVTHAIAGNYDFLLTVDADGQFPPEEVRKVLLSALDSDSDATLASRFLNHEWAADVPKARARGNRVVRLIVNMISGKKVSDATCGLRVYNRNAFTILHPTEKFSYTVESITQLLLSNMKVHEVPIRVLYFEDRNSTISGSLFKYGLKTIAIASRLAISFALTRLLRKSTWLILIGASLEVLFFYRSEKSGQFSGNLYLGLSGAMIFFIGFASFFFYLISLKLDQNLKMSLTTQRLLIAKTPDCLDCVKND